MPQGRSAGVRIVEAVKIIACAAGEHVGSLIAAAKLTAALPVVTERQRQPAFITRLANPWPRVVELGARWWVGPHCNGDKRPSPAVMVCRLRNLSAELHAQQSERVASMRRGRTQIRN